MVFNAEEARLLRSFLSHGSTVHILSLKHLKELVKKSNVATGRGEGIAVPPSTVWAVGEDNASEGRPSTSQQTGRSPSRQQSSREHSRIQSRGNIVVESGAIPEQDDEEEGERGTRLSGFYDMPSKESGWRKVSNHSEAITNALPAAVSPLETWTRLEISSESIGDAPRPPKHTISLNVRLAQ